MFSLFEEIVKFLNREQIPYMLTGSVALSIYVIPRATRDIDFVVELKEENIATIASHFKEGYYCDQDAITDSVRRKILFNIIQPATGFKADFIPLRHTRFEQHKFNRRRQVEYFGELISVITPEDLLLSKLEWMQDSESLMQATDIRNLLENHSLDRSYLHRWIQELRLRTFDLPI